MCVSVNIYYSIKETVQFCMLAIYNKFNYYQYDDDDDDDTDSDSMRLNMCVKHHGSRKNTFSFELYALCNCYWQTSKANIKI